MRKTFLKVALIGLLVGSLPVGFTSCKDYDDDIEQTNNQVADLKTKLASVETAIAALPSKADVTAAQAAAVAQAKADLEAVKAELQKAIDGKADKEAVEAINTELSKIQGQLETIDALKADVATALEAVSKVTTLEEKAQAQGQLIAGIQAQIAELTENGTTQFADITEQLTALKTAVNDPANGLDALKKQIAELADKIQGQGGEAASLEATLRVINGMVTSLRIVSDWGASKHNNELWLFDPVEAENVPVGPKGETLLFDIAKDQVKHFTDSILVQVSPAGATLTQDQLTLVNSQAQETLKGYVTINNVRAFNKSTDILVSSRATSINGLYVVYFSQDPIYNAVDDKKQAGNNPTNFDKATKDNGGKGKQIRFAIALNEKNAGGSRDVITPWDLTVRGGTTKPTTTLNYTVDGKSVTSINNRFLYAGDGSSYMYVERSISNPTSNMKGVYAAAGSIASFNAAINQGYAPVGDYKTGSTVPVLDTDDDRTAQPYYNVEVDKAFKVKLAGVSAEYPVYGYYVALDILRATESGESERAAWTRYAENIEGLNKVYACEETIEMTIKAAANVPGGDVIGFRVWAVNYDGSLVDPDGRAFYVMVGEEGQVETDALGLNTFVATSATANLAATSGWNVQNGINYSDKLGTWTTAYEEVYLDFQMENAEDKGLMAANGVTVQVSIPYYNNTRLALKSSTPTDPDDGKAFMSNLEILKDADEDATMPSLYSSYYAYSFSSIRVTINSVNFVDGNKYKGYIYIYSDELKSRLLQKIPVNITKDVPTALPSWFTVAAGLTDAAGNICIFADATKTNGAVTASFANVFRDTRGNGSYIGPNAPEWNNFAFGIKILDPQDATWANPATPAYYTNIISGNTNPKFRYIGWNYGDGIEVYAEQKDPTTLSLTPAQGATSIVKEVANADEPTLSMVNGGAQDLTIWYQYKNVAYTRPAAANIKTADPKSGNAIVKGSKNLLVQTYPNTYTLSAPAMPALNFNKRIALSANTISVSSNWTTAVTNVALPTISASDYNALYRIVQPAGKQIVTLTGNVAQYFSAETVNNTVTNGEYANLTIDASTGVVTVKNAFDGLKEGDEVYGIAVKSVTTSGVTTYSFDYTKTSTQLIFFKPVEGLTNAPATAVSGNLTIQYVDALGLGSDYNYSTGKIVPYSKSYGITLNP